MCIYSDADWTYYTEPQEYCCNWKVDQKDYWPRGKVMGGSGVLNYMMWVRGHKDDWNYIMNVDNWKWNDVLPYFEKIETLHSYNDRYSNKQGRGYNGPVIVNDARNFLRNTDEFQQNVIDGIKNSGMINFLENGQNMNGDNIGFAYTEYNIDDTGHRNNAFFSYNKYLKKNYPNNYVDNLDILPNAHVLRILFDTEDDINTIGVVFADKSDNNIEYTVRLNTFGEVIVSGGAINSPQLLMLSGLGPKEDLQKLNIDVIKNIPGIGNNLQDHMMVLQRWQFKKEYEHLSTTLDKVMNELNDFKEFKDYLFQGKSIMSTSGANINGFYRSNVTNSKYGSTTQYPDIQIYFLLGFHLPDMGWNYIPNITLTNECGKSEYWSDRPNMKTIITAVGLMHPESDGYIKLRSTDPFEYPIIQPNYLKEQYDVDVLMDGIKFLKKLMNVKEIKKMWDDELECKSYGNIYNNDTALEQFIRDSLVNIYHPSM